MTKFLDKQVHSVYYTGISEINKNSGYFRHGFGTLISGKIFDKFRKSFRHLEALFIFVTFLPVGIPKRSIFAKDRIAKFFVQRIALPNSLAIQTPYFLLEKVI